MAELHTHLLVLPVCKSHSTMLVSSEPLYNKLSSGCHWTQFTPPLWPPSWQRKTRFSIRLDFFYSSDMIQSADSAVQIHQLDLKVYIWFSGTTWNFKVRQQAIMQVTAGVCGSSNPPAYSAGIPWLSYKWAPSRLLCPSPTGPRSPPPVPPRISSSFSEVSPKKMTHLWRNFKKKEHRHDTISLACISTSVYISVD